MTDDRARASFFEVMTGLPREGPGDPESTCRALDAVPNVSANTRVLDIGCGTGGQTQTLLTHAPFHVVAIDTHPPFLTELNRRARRLGVARRLDTRVGDMRGLDFPPASFDLLWCEGAIYNIGFEAGLQAWRPLLASDGHLVVSEVAWVTTAPPQPCLAFWMREYPSIRPVPALLTAIDQAGYNCLAHFPIPTSAWWENYYGPLQENVTTLRRRYAGDDDAERVAQAIQQEIDIWQQYGAHYAYEFFVMGAR